MLDWKMFTNSNLSNSNITKKSHYICVYSCTHFYVIIRNQLKTLFHQAIFGWERKFNYDANQYALYSMWKKNVEFMVCYLLFLATNS